MSIFLPGAGPARVMLNRTRRTGAGRYVFAISSLLMLASHASNTAKDITVKQSPAARWCHRMAAMSCPPGRKPTVNVDGSKEDRPHEPSGARDVICDLSKIAIAGHRSHRQRHS